MIRLESILTPGRSLVNVPGGSKKRVLEQIAKVIAQDLPDLDAQAIFESLIAREKLGSTGFGNGIAIPHCLHGGLQFAAQRRAAPGSTGGFRRHRWRPGRSVVRFAGTASGDG
ncbi:hypothetical protein SSTU70S_01129 [Stutzerimonas stutzeri]